MNHLVFLDAEAGELEKILSGIKCVVVNEYDPSLPPKEVSPGDGLFFLRNNDECTVRVQATAMRVWFFEDGAEEDLTHHLKELQTRLQLTEDQFNYWSTKKRARFIEFEAAHKIPIIHIELGRIVDRNGSIILEDPDRPTEEGSRAENPVIRIPDPGNTSGTHFEQSEKGQSAMNTAGIPRAENIEQEHPKDVHIGSERERKARLFALVEVLLAYGVLQTIILVWRNTALVGWEFQNLGWSYTAGLLFILLPALVIWLGRRNWVDYGVSLANWRTNLDVGIKAYLVSLIPYVLGVAGAMALRLDYRQMAGGTWVALTNIVAIALMVRILNRHKPVTSGRANVILVIVLLLFPIVLALWMGKLSLIILSTAIWQFVLSGFGEEFMFRGYLQGRLNQAFGRPYRIFGIQFGPGLLIAAVLFGLLHAFNGFNAETGIAGMYWGWALWTTLGGLFLGILREKTGTILASGIAHGLPDAIGEPLIKLLGLAV